MTYLEFIKLEETLSILFDPKQYLEISFNFVIKPSRRVDYDDFLVHSNDKEILSRIHTYASSGVQEYGYNPFRQYEFREDRENLQAACLRIAKHIDLSLAYGPKENRTKRCGVFVSHNNERECILSFGKDYFEYHRKFLLSATAREIRDKYEIKHVDNNKLVWDYITDNHSPDLFLADFHVDSLEKKEYYLSIMHGYHSELSDLIMEDIEFYFSRNRLD